MPLPFPLKFCQCPHQSHQISQTTLFPLILLAVVMSVGALWAWHTAAIEEEMLGAPTLTPPDVGDLP